MAYTWARRKELAAQRLDILGVPESERRGVNPYRAEQKLGLTNEAKRAEWVRQHDWFYQGMVGSTSREPGPYDSPSMARDYVRGFLYKGHETPSRKAARDRVTDVMGGKQYVPWTQWRERYEGFAAVNEPDEDDDLYEEE